MVWGSKPAKIGLLENYITGTIDLLYKSLNFGESTVLQSKRAKLSIICYF